MKQVLYIDAERTGYSIDQIHSTMTAWELMNYLEQFDEDTPVYLRHDGGYTYGGISWNSFADEEIEDEEIEDEE